MKLVVGLGNPGPKYNRSRHNLGFLVVKELAKKYKIKMTKKTNKFLLGEGAILGERGLVVLPLTYMNSSGQAVEPLIKDKRIDLKDMLVVCDDVNLKLGGIRIRPAGCAGGHKGLRSIIDSLNSQLFPRLRLGVSIPGKIKDLAQFVLAPFTKKEMKIVKEMVTKSIEVIELWVGEGIEAAMNEFNKRGILE